MLEQIWLYVGVALTLLVLIGYLLGENNILFRLATYIFVGVAAGYIFVVVIYQVILPRVVNPLLSGNPGQIILVIVPVLLSLLLMAKLSPRLAGLGTIPMAYLVGVGAAVAIGGAVLGTLLTQALATVNLFDIQTNQSVSPVLQLADAVFALAGTLSALAYFHFGARIRNRIAERAGWINLVAKVGGYFIAVTLGALFAGVFTASLTALIQRLEFLWSVFRTFF